MAEFQPEKLELFLGVVRKYMQVRGSLSQKELAELTEVGVSTMSRFLNKKTTELNPQLIAKIVAALRIPLHEVIDFVDEDYTDRFIRLVKFYRDDPETEVSEAPEAHNEQAEPGRGQINALQEEPSATGSFQDPMEEALYDNLKPGGAGSTAKRNVQGHIRVGDRQTPISYASEGSGESRNRELNLSDKIQNLSPRQKAYLHDFLSLDMEGRDLMVDLGNNLFRYFKQKGMEL